MKVILDKTAYCRCLLPLLLLLAYFLPCLLSAFSCLLPLLSSPLTSLPSGRQGLRSVTVEDESNFGPDCLLPLPTAVSSAACLLSSLLTAYFSCLLLLPPATSSSACLLSSLLTAYFSCL